ncbi:MAG: putative Ig domain-containing protein [Gemmatimonadetes bacterium]|nr:putative Ig domain-containing protein [Gemmatimonadota bacterium]
MPNLQSVLYSIAISVILVSGHVSAQSPSAPAAVTNLAAVAGDQQVTLSWDNPNNESITTYQYRQSTDGGSNWSPDWTNIANSNKNTTSHTVENLINDTAYTFEVRAVNATGNGTSVSVSATPTLPPLTVTWPEDIKGTEDSSIWTSLTSTPPQISVSGGRPSYTYEIETDEIETEGAPDGLSIDSSGTLTGTPTENGTFTVRVVVRDKADQSMSQDLNITIRPALNVSPIAYKTVEQDSSITPIHLSASGGWEPYTYSISGAPSGISLSDDNRITGSPSQAGTSTITVTVTDTRGSTGEHSFKMSVYSIELAEKFSPILILTEHPTRKNRIVLFPEPVEIMGAESVDNLWFHFADAAGHRLNSLDFSYDALKSEMALPGIPQPLTALINAYQNQYLDIDFSQNQFASIPEELYLTSPIIIGIVSTSRVYAHFEYPGNDKVSWNNTYTGSGAKRGDNSEFSNTAYVHIFESGSNVVIQYYYFYPFNDFQNNHEGDWQHINVIVTSHEPDMAELVGIDYKFHNNGLTYNSIGGRVFDPQVDFAPAEGGTHPVVYIGAGSHGGYPTGGSYPDPGKPGLSLVGDEDMTKSGIVLSTNIEDTNREDAQSYDLIFLPNPDPNQPNKGLPPEMSWLGTGARWGTLDVPSSGSAERYDESPIGPTHKDSWGMSDSENSYPHTNVPYGQVVSITGPILRHDENSERWFQQFPIVQNVTWQDTIKLIGDIVIYPGATLTIQAGTTIKAYPNRDIHDRQDANRVDIINYGKITANGTSDQRVVFRSDSATPASGDWYGIRNYGTLTMMNCDIQHAVAGLKRQGTDTLVDVVVTNSENNTSSFTVASIDDKTEKQYKGITPIQVNASGGWEPYTYSLSGAPQIITISDSGLITGTPTLSGTFTLNVKVESHDSQSESISFQISVSQGLNVAPISDVTVKQDHAITAIQVSVSGGSGTYRYSISGAPSGISIDSSTGRITGTPTESGAFTIGVHVQETPGGGAGGTAAPITGSRSFTMTVNAPASKPVSSALTVAETDDITVKISAVTNSAITPIQVSASGGQTPYTYALSSNPATGAGLTINSSSGQITGTPTQTGTFTLTVTVTDHANKTATDSFSMAVSLMGDFNGDGAVNTSDHLLFVAAFGLSEGEDGFNSEMDLNGDGTIDIADFLIFSSHFPNAN